MTEAERVQFEQDIRPVKLILGKIRALSFKIIHSTTKLLPAWKTLCRMFGLEENLLPRDVKTRWNSTYDMVAAALKYRKVVEAICADKKLGLRKFELSGREWVIMKQLSQVFKDATLFFSRSTPNLAKVIPAIDHIDQVLTTAEVTPDKYNSTIQIACGLGKKTLNKYYLLTDASINYRIAMGAYICT
ncbi:hypothetical protein K466DRAFT_613823 [Polyporus arcularius HHB13444]|uniref:Uncharacterized protein n=1 Tax=Polyporus arcularius HHB13444 TaxID=1314778 RepID=A0A5C3NYJ0_9APHY|nr:hypothetical protein K466DRAFT_613823 [Polyporus arcularius HHB13444]